MSLMLGSLRLTRWGPVLQHLRLLLIASCAICRTLAWPCNVWWQILNPEHTQAWVPAVEVCAVDSSLTPPWAGSTAWTLSLLWHSLSPAAGLYCHTVLMWSASPWHPSCTVTKGDTDRDAALQLQELPHKLSYELSWKSPYKPACPQGATRSYWPFEP